jgi:uncharacterized RDD family membrane protein YckC
VTDEDRITDAPDPERPDDQITEQPTALEADPEPDGQQRWNPRRSVDVRIRDQSGLASRGLRLAAAVIDWTIFIAIVLLGNIEHESLNRHRGADQVPPTVVCFMWLWWILQAVLLSTRGQTVGKLIVNIRIVRFEDGRNPGFGAAVLLRWIIPFLLFIIPCVGFLFFLSDSLSITRQSRRCYHDHLAGTVVVNGDAPQPPRDRRDDLAFRRDKPL